MKIGDSNKDGKLSRAKFGVVHSGEEMVFAGLDRKADGYVDAAETRAAIEGKCGASKGGADKAFGSEGQCGGPKKMQEKASSAEGACGASKAGGQGTCLRR